MLRAIFWMLVTIAIVTVVLSGFGYWKMFELNLWFGVVSISLITALAVITALMIWKCWDILKEKLSKLTVKDILKIIWNMFKKKK